MAKAIAVLCSDIHYNLQTLPLADAAMRQAISKANSLRVPLIVAGDLHDSKANMRAECVNAMLKTFFEEPDSIDVYILRGNHDQINEKSQEHSLNFLNPHAYIVDDVITVAGCTLIPYQHNPEDFKKALSKNTINIVHQGLLGSESGEYIQDRSAVTKKDVAGLRIVSGHYHCRQTIKLPLTGEWDYIGNPYTLNFGEANDPEKGYQILMSDGSLEFVPTNLRKHVVIDLKWNTTDWLMNPGSSHAIDIKDEDLVWVKLTASKEKLVEMTKQAVAKLLYIKQSFKLDLIPTISAISPPNRSGGQAEMLDAIIDKIDTTNKRKQVLKELWKDMK